MSANTLEAVRKSAEVIASVKDIIVQIVGITPAKNDGGVESAKKLLRQLRVNLNDVKEINPAIHSHIDNNIVKLLQSESLYTIKDGAQEFLPLLDSFHPIPEITQKYRIVYKKNYMKAIDTKYRHIRVELANVEHAIMANPRHKSAIKFGENLYAMQFQFHGQNLFLIYRIEKHRTLFAFVLKREDAEAEESIHFMDILTREELDERQKG